MGKGPRRNSKEGSRVPRANLLGQGHQSLRGHHAIIAAAERISSFGTFLHDPETDEAVWSLQLKRIFGFPEDDLPVKLSAFLQRVHPDDLPTLDDVFRSLKRVGDCNEHSYRIVLPDGTCRVIHASAELVRMEGFDRPVLVGTALDRTEHEAARQLIVEQAAALEAVQAELLYLARQSAMGTMAATLAHELNQPLAAIAFSIAAARRLAAAGEADRADETLILALDNAHRAGEIIRRLRRSLQTGEPKRERFTSKEVIEESVRFSSIGTVGVRFDLDLADDRIEGADRIQIQQVLVNLIRNACQATAGRPDPRITITSRIVPATAMLRVTVDDNGPGIPDDLLPRLFEGGVTTKQAGMGLGLSISRTIIEAHEGRLWAENTPTGARVGFEIPLHAGAAGGDEVAERRA